jgi:hypothetical protein
LHDCPRPSLDSARGTCLHRLRIQPLGKLFEALSSNFGQSFLQRANEAVQCHRFSAYLACCAMCGAAAEAILLAVAIKKTGDEAATLKTYGGQGGRYKVTKSVT